MALAAARACVQSAVRSTLAVLSDIGGTLRRMVVAMIWRDSRCVVVHAPFALLPPGEEFLRREEGTPASEPCPRDNARRQVPERLQFIEALGPTEVVEGVEQLGREEYRAYVVRTARGAFALVECEFRKNALYVLKADSPNWLALLKLTKLELLTGNYPEFLGRIVHQGDWQGRVRALIS